MANVNVSIEKHGSMGCSVCGTGIGLHNMNLVDFQYEVTVSGCTCSGTTASGVGHVYVCDVCMAEWFETLLA